MNQELQRIWMQYIKMHTIYTGYKSHISFNGEFFNSFPIYAGIMYSCKIKYRMRIKNKYFSWHKNCSCGNKWTETDSKFLFCPDKVWFEEFKKNMILRLKYFDLKECKNFVNYKNKEILRTIFLCLLPKLNSDCIFMILSFIRRIDLGYIF